ncbi:type I restriction-modification enzyme R subunit C-terminal domain-containing protein [Parvimonas micra]|uniref:type I restriction endonuclease subunit R n=1 Tax=Parvimonas micra TaxID=33033 RepID=UPI00200530F8|nr:DEAD/DEAH box helicase family protein [Parvimonas micra]MCK6130265.1 DEAD/DEAH box helicase family protein [Parvimonas micra]MCK6135911.1 DEAD/DEAH box helicase family protein [Parvimonas micra]MCK6137383.1 DEAD/DEAH box helicase family protein [Parvimonas micra]MCK6153910.1 DEAD/DEAH box helicase family protein [Parvimonas micra]
MTPEQEARVVIDEKLEQSGWVVQNVAQLNLGAALGVAVREFPTSTGPVDYALFIDGDPVGVIEAKKSSVGENITVVEEQSARYATSSFKWINREYTIRFAYEATDKLIKFTDYKDIKYRSRRVFSFHRPEYLESLLQARDTIRNNMKHFPALDTTGFRDCQINAINNMDLSFADNRPRALVQMATGAGKTFTAITEAYRLLKYGKMNRILFLVDTKSLGEQAEREFLAYTPNDDTRSFSQLYGVRRLKSSYIPNDVQICISTIQRMYSILKEEDLDESTEEESFNEYVTADSKAPKDVVYNEKYPPEFFDCIIIDECHRSIYNVWQQVLTYFDAFLVGLTATPDKRTFAFFNENVVSEYRREQAIIDGVNVGEDIFLIETEVSQKGGHILKRVIEYRDRLSREKRWEQMDEDFDYDKNKLDKDVVNPSQIRTVIKTFKENLFTSLFPRRKEVPKTLIFAKTDSHADDIINIVREEFGEGNEFCKKITYSVENAESTLSSFRNDYYPRIAVTVDMIATGTDVKPLECLIFMRDVRSKNYFEQMVGRGTRTIGVDDLQKVTPSATENKDHFVIVDAVGVTKSKKSETRSLERKPTVSMKELMMNVALGDKSEDTLTSLANRISRLDKQMTDKEHKEFKKNVGISARDIANNLLNAFDEDVIAEKAKSIMLSSVPTQQDMEKAQKELLDEATKPFYNPDNRDFIENIRRSHDQVIDTVNLDSVVFAGFDSQKEENADKVITSFREFIEENKDEIIALRIIYNESYKDRPMVIEQLKSLYEKLKKKNITIERLWDCYYIKFTDKVKRGTVAQLTDLISIIRFEIGTTDELTSFADRVNANFKEWTFRKNAGYSQFTEEQMEWLRLIKDHIISSLSILDEDLDYTPFDHKGGLLGFYEAFGDNYKNILNEMNVALVA